MTSAQEYRQQITDLGLDRLEITADTAAEAKTALKKVRLFQKQLRQIKRNINQDMKTIRAEYRGKSEKAGSSASAGIFSLFSRGGAKKMVAAERRGLRAERDRILEPYDNVKYIIDDMILKMDQAKLQIDEYIEAQKAEGG